MHATLSLYMLGSLHTVNKRLCLLLKRPHLSLSNGEKKSRDPEWTDHSSGLLHSCKAAASLLGELNLLFRCIFPILPPGKWRLSYHGNNASTLKAHRAAEHLSAPRCDALTSRNEWDLNQILHIWLDCT